MNPPAHGQNGTLWVLAECLQQKKCLVESKGKEGKSPRINLGYKRNNTHEQGRNKNKNERTTMKRMRKWEEHKKNNKSPVTEEVRNSQLKVKEERKRKKCET